MKQPMHPVIARALATFVAEQLGKEISPSAVLHAKPGIEGLPERYYYHHDVHEILREVSRRSAQTFSQTCEEFGRALGPRLLEKYGGLLRGSHDTLSVIASVELLLHGVLLMNDAGTSAEIACESHSPHELSVVYRSPRKLCAVVRGVAWSVGAARNDRVMIAEPHCMLNGVQECRLILTTAASEGAGSSAEPRSAFAK